MRKFMTEFKAFILRGNVIELAVGMLMGTSFSALVGNFSEAFLNPIISRILGGAGEVNFVWSVFGAELQVGTFISALISFIITALVAFLVVKGYNALQQSFIKKESTKEVATGPTQEELLAEILKELKK